MSVRNAFVINPNQMLQMGLELIGGFKPKESPKRKLEVFRSHYRRHPKHLCEVWRDLQIVQTPERMDPIEAQSPKSYLGFMMANHFLNCFTTNNCRAITFKSSGYLGGINEVTNLTWRFVKRIAALKDFKIKMPDTWSETFIMSVDGTHFHLNEPRDPVMRRNPVNYSFKFNLAGLNYEIALHLWASRCVHAKTQERGSVNDILMFRKSLLQKIPEGKRVIADKGYTAGSDEERCRLAVPNTLDSEEVKRFKSVARSRHENYNRLLKHYQCLNQKFRHGMQRHQLCFDACVVLVEYAIEDESKDGEPLNRL